MTLAFVLLMTSAAGIASAADTVTGLEFDYDTSDYNSSSNQLEMYVENDSVNVTLMASISGASTKKDVTASATWKTTNSAAVKVDKGVLTGLSKGSATISATYEGFTIYIKAYSDYVYDEVVLLNKGVDAGKTATVNLGDKLVYTLNGSKSTKSEDVTLDATWTSSNSSVATVDDGEVTLAGVGTTTITAKLKGKTDTITLTVQSPYESISISPSAVLDLEVDTDDTELSATAKGKDGKDYTVTSDATWTSGNTAVVTVDKGVVTPVGTGTTKITVSYRGVSTTVEVVVRTPYQSLKLSPEKEYHLQLQDDALQITAEVLTNSNTQSTVTGAATWTSSNLLVATVAAGKVTPKGAGTTKITATYKGLTRSIQVTVYPSIKALTVETTSIDSFVGDSEKFPTVKATTFDGEEVDVTSLTTWTSSDETIAVADSGKWTAKAIGETVFTANVQDYSVDVKLIVHVKPLKLLPEYKDTSIIIGKEVALPSITVVNEDGEEEDVSSSVKWKTTSDNIVLKTTTMRGLEASSVTLTATYLNKSVTVKVKIEEEIVKLVAELSKIELYPGSSKSIKVTGYYASGKTISLSSKMGWTVNPTTLATIKTTTVKGLVVGSGKLVGSYQGKTLEIPIVVSPKLKSLTLSEKSAKLSAGQSLTIKLQANYTTGAPVDATSSAVWTTTKSSVATVNNGKITAVSKGTASIKATYSGKTVTFRVTVK